jgi:hypothetical protein
MKKIFNFQQFIKESYGANCPACESEPCVCEHNEMHDHMHTDEPETIDVEHEELEFCPQCGEDWEYCICGGHHDMTHVPSHEMELVAHEDYTFLDEEETNEKKKAKGESYEKSGLKHPEKADLNKDKKISSYEKKRGKAVQDSMEDKDHEDGKKHKEEKGLTAKQKKLPEALQKSILKNKK